MLNKPLNDYIDHTILKPFASTSDILSIAKECREYQLFMIAINSYPVKFVKEYLKDTQVHVGAAIGFPLGQTTIQAKVFESNDAIENGCDEIDYVINISALKDGNLAYIEDEMRQIVELCKKNGILSKVILETCYLTDEEIVNVCKIAREVKPNYVKTSTGFGTAGATVHHVALMKETVGDEVSVKAAGGIRDLDTCLAMIEAGAERIGTSNGPKIMEEYYQRYGRNSL